MAKRRTREEMLAEFHRLYDCFECLDQTINRLFPSPPELQLTGPISRDEMLSFVQNGKATLSQICSGAREGINDSLDVWQDLQDEDHAKADLFLQTYKALSGHDLWEDVDTPKTVVKALLKNGNLHSAEEFRLLKAQLDDQRTTLSGKDRNKAEGMLAEFEDSYQGDD